MLQDAKTVEHYLSAETPSDFHASLRQSIEAIRNLLFLANLQATEPDSVRNYLMLAEQWLTMLDTRVAEECLKTG